MVSGEFGHHGQYALRVVGAVKGPVIENVMIPPHFMAEQHAVAIPGNATNAIKISVQVTTLIMQFFIKTALMRTLFAKIQIGPYNTIDVHYF